MRASTTRQAMDLRSRLALKASSGSDSRGVIIDPNPDDCSGVDLREFQHGIDFVPKADGTYWMLWSSAGNSGVPNNPLPIPTAPDYS